MTGQLCIPTSTWLTMHRQERDQAVRVACSGAGPRHGCCGIPRVRQGWGRMSFQGSPRLQCGFPRPHYWPGELTLCFSRLSVDLATGLDHVQLDDGEPDPRAAGGPVARLVNPVEAFENSLQLVCRYA